MLRPSFFRTFLIAGVAVLPSVLLISDSRFEPVGEVRVLEGGLALAPNIRTRVTVTPWPLVINVPVGMGLSVMNVLRDSDSAWAGHRAQCREWGSALEDVVDEAGNRVASVCWKRGAVIQ